MPVIRPPRWHVLCIRHGEDVGRLRLERPVDLSEADGEYVLTAELHGVDPEDVEIDVELRGEEESPPDGAEREPRSRLRSGSGPPRPGGSPLLPDRFGSSTSTNSTLPLNLGGYRMETAGPSGSIEIKGATWHWRLLDPRAEPPSGDEGEDAAFISFHSADDPSREMRCVVSEGVDREFSDEEVRDLFDQAWAVKS